MCNLTSTDSARKVYQVVISTDVRLHRQWDHVGNFTGIFFDLRHDNSHDDILCHPGKVFTRDTKKEDYSSPSSCSCWSCVLSHQVFLLKTSFTSRVISEGSKKTTSWDL